LTARPTDVSLPIMTDRADRAERFELRFSKAEANQLRELARERGMSSADYVRYVVNKSWEEYVNANRAMKLERLAIVSLNEMCNRPNVSCGVAFTTFEAGQTTPRATVDAGPQPLASNMLQAPLIGNVAVQGFARALDEGERVTVQDRFPGWTATWLSNA
jgi:hypothetical protein